MKNNKEGSGLLELCLSYSDDKFSSFFVTSADPDTMH